MTKQIPDPYVVLGVPHGADDQQMRDAYRRLAKRYHPDLHPDAETSERMRRVNQAWDTLSVPARRARYDTDHPRAAWPPRGSSRTSGAQAGSERPWQPAWASGATRTGRDSRAPGWAASSWTARRAIEQPATSDDRGTSGAPMLPLAAVVIVGGLAIGGIFGGFLLPVVLGLLVVIGVSWVLDRGDRGA